MTALISSRGRGGNWGSTPVDVFERLYTVTAAPYLARGDGATDDRAAIQAALDAAGDAGGGIVYVPQGTFMLSKGLQVPSNVHLQGSGAFTTTLKFLPNVDTSDPVMSEYLANIVSMWNVEGASCSHMTLDGDRDNQPEFVSSVAATNLGSTPGCIRIGGTAFTAERSRNCAAFELRLINSVCESGVITMAEDCHFYRVYSADHGKGAWDVNALTISIYATNCTIVECEGWRCVHGGLELYSPVGATPNESVNYGCAIERCRTDNIIMNPANGDRTRMGGSRIVDNWIDTTGRPAVTGAPTSCHGIVCNGAVDEVVIEGNTIIMGNGSAISVGAGPVVGPGDANNPRHVTIRNNTCVRRGYTAASFSDAIILQDVDNAIVEGNHTAGQMGGINLLRCLAARVMGNVLFAQYTGAESFVGTDNRAASQVMPFDAQYHPRYGIQLYNCTDCDVIGNTVRGFAWAAIAEEPGTAANAKLSKRNRFEGNNLWNNGVDPTVATRSPNSFWGVNTYRPYVTTTDATQDEAISNCDVGNRYTPLHLKCLGPLKVTVNGAERARMHGNGGLTVGHTTALATGGIGIGIGQKFYARDSTDSYYVDLAYTDGIGTKFGWFAQNTLVYGYGYIAFNIALTGLICFQIESAAIVLGQDGAGAAKTLRGATAAGANTAAGDLTIRPPLSTGNAAPGTIVMQASVTGASGGTSQTVLDAAQVTDATADGLTGLLVLVNRAGVKTVSRVKVGAAGTGPGGGGRALYVDS